MKLVLLSVLVLNQVYAQEFCSIENPYLLSKREVSDTPNYFFRTFPDSNMVSYNGSGTNYILNLDTGEKTRIPGPYDPVPTWDERVMTNPSIQGRMEFYDIRKLLDKDHKFDSDARIHSDRAMQGVYQSIGNLEPDGSKVRIITDENNITIRDYEIDTSSDPIEVRSISRPVTGCEGFDIKLPMISKDGRHLAARDMNQSPPTTRLFRLDDDGNCEMIKDLGVQAGKVDFNFDGTKLVFHQSVDQVESEEYFESPTTVQDIFVYDLQTDSMKKITNNAAGNTSYYPVWRRDDTIVYIDRDEEGQFAFSVADPMKLLNQNIQATSVVQNCINPRESILQILGETWMDICLESQNQDSQNSVLTALSMEKNKCEQMVNAHVEQLRNRARSRNIEFNKSEFLAACPQTSIEEVEREEEVENTIDAAQLFSTKCAMCHGDVNNYKNTPARMPNSKKSKWMDEAIERMNSTDETYHMPKGSSLNPNEKKALEKYMKDFLAE